MFLQVSVFIPTMPWKGRPPQFPPEGSDTDTAMGIRLTHPTGMRTYYYYIKVQWKLSSP